MRQNHKIVLKVQKMNYKRKQGLRSYLTQNSVCSQTIRRNIWLSAGWTNVSVRLQQTRSDTWHQKIVRNSLFVSDWCLFDQTLTFITVAAPAAGNHHSISQQILTDQTQQHSRNRIGWGWGWGWRVILGWEGWLLFLPNRIGITTQTKHMIHTQDFNKH